MSTQPRAPGPAARPFAVLADDLTGAGDVGLQFVTAGLRTGVFFGALPATLAGLEVVVLDTGTRARLPAAAAAQVQAAFAALRAAGAALVYKKIDSTLRGNLGAEVDVLLSAGEFGRAIFCPAYPAQGRILVDGVLRVDGAPVATTAAGRDPVTPVAESHLPTLLRQQVRRPVRHLTLADVAAGAATLAPLLDDGPAGELVVCDAATEAELATIAAAATMATGKALLVGAAGLAAPLAQQLAAGSSGQVLVLCGSLHPVARTQIAVLAATGHLLALDAAACDDDAAWAAWLAALPKRLRGGAGRGQPLVLATPGAVTGDAMLLARRLAEAATVIAGARRVAGVVVTGGDTLRSLLDAWQATGLELTAVVAPGIPLGRIRGGPQAGLPIVTKAGGFGAPDALVVAVQALTNWGGLFT